MKMSVERWRNGTDRGKPFFIRPKMSQCHFYPPKIPYGLTRNGTWASGLRWRKLSALAIARPWRLQVMWIVI